jgi:hypothetical protein
LCSDGGKIFRNWSRLDRAKELIAFFAQNNDKSCRSEVNGSFYEIKLQNNDILNKKITGQYVQKEFILDIASWISPKFEQKCRKFMQIYESQSINDEKDLDIFEFITKKTLPIANDVTRPWFQELWYPISKKQHILETMLLLDWMGYAGEYFTQKQAFRKFLNNNKIPYEEIFYNDARFSDHPTMIREIEQTGANNLEKKKWLVMDVRNFKKAVMRLNTKNGETVRDYYLNLEEACFEYGQYIMERRNIRQRAKLIAMEEEKLSAIQNLKIKDKELEKEQKLRHQEQKLRQRAERKALNVQKFMNHITVKEQKLEWIYIGTTEQYALDRIFKIGSTSRLAARIPQYNVGRIKGDNFYYAWAMKCYNAKDVDYHIQKLLSDFKYRDPNQTEETNKNNRVEMYHGIKFSDLTDILKFIVENYDKSVEFINNFIKVRLNNSLEEEDEVPQALDLKKITYQIGDHEEVIDVAKENEMELKTELKNILKYYRNQNERNSNDVMEIVLDRKDLVNKLNKKTSESKMGLWTKIKNITGWTKSTVELEQSDSEEEEKVKYKIKY